MLRQFDIVSSNELIILFRANKYLYIYLTKKYLGIPYGISLRVLSKLNVNDTKLGLETLTDINICREILVLA